MLFVTASSICMQKDEWAKVPGLSVPFLHCFITVFVRTDGNAQENKQRLLSIQRQLHNHKSNLTLQDNLRWLLLAPNIKESLRKDRCLEVIQLLIDEHHDPDIKKCGPEEILEALYDNSTEIPGITSFECKKSKWWFGKKSNKCENIEELLDHIKKQRISEDPQSGTEGV